jgi:mono/diheme cytochrome c family protein
MNAELRFMSNRMPLRVAVILAAAVSMSACSDWFTTFTHQPSVHPWEVATMDTSAAARLTTPPRGSPQGSVPLYGGSPPNWLFSYTPIDGTIDSMSVMVNPTPPSDASIANGQKYYQINCAVCHGSLGAGDGPATASGMMKMSLLSETAMARSDGNIYGVIRNGRGIMPSYNRIEHMDRWDLVNYIRGLQGKLGRTVPTGPLGVPGETGTKVPGSTMIGPQRPIPHFPPGKIGSGG